MSASKELFSCDLSRITLPSVLQLLEAETVSGWVQVTPEGRIGLLSGRIVAAEMASFRGVTALLELFIVGGDHLRFVEDTTLSGPAIGDVVGLIMEGCRLADEWGRLEEVYLAPPALEGEVDPDIAKVLKGVGTGAFLKQLVLQTGVARANVTDGLAELMASGQIWEGDAPEGMRPDGTLPDYFESIDAGRDLMRAKDYAAAQAAFEAALRARPDDRIAKQNLRRATELNQAGGTAFQQWFKRT